MVRYEKCLRIVHYASEFFLVRLLNETQQLLLLLAYYSVLFDVLAVIEFMSSLAKKEELIV